MNEAALREALGYADHPFLFSYATKERSGCLDVLGRLVEDCGTTYTIRHCQECAVSEELHGPIIRGGACV